MSHNGCHGFVDRSKPLDFIISYNFVEWGCKYISSAYLELIEGNEFDSPTPVTKTFNATISGINAVCTINTLGVGKTYTYITTISLFRYVTNSNYLYYIKL